MNTYDPLNPVTPIVQLRALVVEFTTIDSTVEPVPGMVEATLVTQADVLLLLTVIAQPTALDNVTEYPVPTELTATVEGAGLAPNTHCEVLGANVAVTD